MAQNQFQVGQHPATLRVTYLDQDGDPVTPAAGQNAVLRVQRPQGSTFEVSATHQGSGVYEGVFADATSLTESGTYKAQVILESSNPDPDTFEPSQVVSFSVGSNLTDPTP